MELLKELVATGAISMSDIRLYLLTKDLFIVSVEDYDQLTNPDDLSKL